MKIAHRVLGLLFALPLLFAAGESAAQSYPSKPVKFVVGLPPGGGTDILARLIGQKLAEQLGQQIIVENKPGADAQIATEQVAKSAPDGYTLLVGTSSGMILNPSLYPVPYDVLKDFIPITVFGPAPVVFAAHPSFAATSVKELIALARAKPGALHYSTGGTVFQVAGELIKQQAGVNIVHVPYKGSSPAINAALAGDVPMVATSIAAVLPQLKAGKLRALAVTSTRRSLVLPEVPTVAESGLANYEYMMWTGLFAPAATPRAIIDKLYGEMSAALKSDRLKERFAGLSYETGGIVGMPPAEFAAMHRAELAKWTKLVKELNIRPE
ncbi:MAG: tripartite tricarboxylate transporter substrate binding protein [Betaproteobacteria bacterium]|nr:tripartite tricarboxylate transporter substrate binding protein [Betaproteobacteria bacterium]